MASDVELFLNQIRKNYDKISKEVINQVSKKVDKDIKQEVKTCLKMYYDSYKPKVYKRTKALKRITTPIMEKSALGCTVGVLYESSPLEGVHFSNSRKHQGGDQWQSVVGKSFAEVGSDNGIPDADWIFDRFMLGQHPDGGSGFISGGYNIETHMSDFFDNKLPSKIPGYVSDALAEAVSKYM